MLTIIHTYKNNFFPQILFKGLNTFVRYLVGGGGGCHNYYDRN